MPLDSRGIFYYNKHMLTQKKLKELLKYDPETGVFIWCNKKPTKSKNWPIAGCIEETCVRIQIDNKRYGAHQLAWLYTYGYIPVLIDHINRNCFDNSIKNLRIATSSQNAQNRPKCKVNTSGYKGVSFHKRQNKWRVMINLGSFDTVEEAALVYNRAAKYHFGDFAYLNDVNPIEDRNEMAYSV